MSGPGVVRANVAKREDALYPCHGFLNSRCHLSSFWPRCSSKSHHFLSHPSQVPELVLLWGKDYSIRNSEDQEGYCEMNWHAAGLFPVKKGSPGGGKKGGACVFIRHKWRRRSWTEYWRCAVGRPKVAKDLIKVTRFSVFPRLHVGQTSSWTEETAGVSGLLWRHLSIWTNTYTRI